MGWTGERASGTLRSPDHFGSTQRALLAKTNGAGHRTIAAVLGSPRHQPCAAGSAARGAHAEWLYHPRPRTQPLMYCATSARVALSRRDLAVVHPANSPPEFMPITTGPVQAGSRRAAMAHGKCPSGAARTSWTAPGLGPAETPGLVAAATRLAGMARTTPETISTKHIESVRQYSFHFALAATWVAWCALSSAGPGSWRGTFLAGETRGAGAGPLSE